MSPRQNTHSPKDTERLAECKANGADSRGATGAETGQSAILVEGLAPAIARASNDWWETGSNQTEG